VGGALSGQFIQLMRDPFLTTYDVLIEESESDPHMKQRYFDAIMQITPMLVRSNQFLPELLDYFPLPRRIIEKLKQAMDQKKQMDQQLRAQGIDPSGRGKSDPPEVKQAKIQKMNADAALTMVKAKALAQKSKTDVGEAMLKVIAAQEQARAAKEQEDQKRMGLANSVLGTLHNATRGPAPSAPQAPMDMGE
jgi:hypothetical protein